MAVEVVAEGHPVNHVHPVGGERRGQDVRMDRMGWVFGERIHTVPKRSPPEQGRWIRNRMNGNIDRFLPVGSGWNGGDSEEMSLHSSHEH